MHNWILEETLQVGFGRGRRIVFISCRRRKRSTRQSLTPKRCLLGLQASTCPSEQRQTLHEILYRGLLTVNKLLNVDDGEKVQKSKFYCLAQTVPKIVFLSGAPLSSAVVVVFRDSISSPAHYIHTGCLITVNKNRQWNGD